jgi:hypothetical protein
MVGQVFFSDGIYGRRALYAQSEERDVIFTRREDGQVGWGYVAMSAKNLFFLSVFTKRI